MKNSILLIVLALTSVPALSQDRCESWGCISTIETLYTNSNGDIYIGTPLDEKRANCTPVSGVYFSLNPSAANADEVYSSLLAAYMAGTKIQLRVKEEHPRCELSYVRLDRKH
ncbi:hypothetical protein [Vibrio neptunius]|uniref:Uncharacterized protein n=1 Tax=Vibrio neptunius TaxID=170651 RepID=A0ABS3ABM5_9VIBR|nr:hypothetical protein [Vibrio neptunius]MBN3495879.1 hypothetical protein [Vibrio neptunius]MBN3518301.1 hypothetical protein [Vibrio neptunius]MBN3552634.1 hypothetical protein [Vibrio neptunius]MBN3580687.1 hypothetical protein [Vibrio neptunius]MCH9874353.1 hypothetical protein [Vibrio neptunius]